MVGPGPAGSGSARTKSEVWVASRANRSVAAGPVTAAGSMSLDGTAPSVANRPFRSDSATRPSAGSRAPGAAAAAVGPGPSATPGFRPGSRSRASSSMTWSSPWPWMNCIA